MSKKIKNTVVKKNNDKLTRILAYVLLVIFAFTVVGSVLAFYLTVKDCNTVKAESVSAADHFSTPALSVPVGVTLNVFFIYSTPQNPSITNSYKLNLAETDFTFSFSRSGSSVTCKMFYRRGSEVVPVPSSPNGKYFPECFTMRDYLIDGENPVTLSAYAQSITPPDGYHFGGMSLSQKSITYSCPDDFDFENVFYYTREHVSDTTLAQTNFKFYDKNDNFASVVIPSYSSLPSSLETVYLKSVDGVYEQGFNDGKRSNVESLGFFEGGTFKYSYGETRNKLPADTEFKDFPSDLKTPFFSGFYFNSVKGSSLTALDNVTTQYGCYAIYCDFGLNGKGLGRYSPFNVLLNSGGVISSSGPIGSAVEFVFTDGSRVDFNTYDNIFSYVDLTQFTGKQVRRVYFYVFTPDTYFFGLNSNADYLNAYNNGFDDGNKSGYDSGYGDGYKKGSDVGYTNGYNKGYNLGTSSSGDYSFLSLIGAVIDAPLQALSGLLDFNLLGFNLLQFFYSIVTCALIVTVVRLFI